MTPQEASQKYHWIKVSEADRTIELYCDHHMLSTLRTCEAKFQLEHLVNLRPHGYKSWNLTYGAFLHKCLEYFYNSMKFSAPPVEINKFLTFAKEMWFAYKLDAYAPFEKKYKTIGGMAGALALLAQYHAYYQDLRVRVVDTEVTFGFEKEVPLGEFKFWCLDSIITLNSYWIIKCFLTGRMDLIIDNGWKLGPVDHKHHTYYRGDEGQKFNPHDGITGYIFALRSILKQRFPDYFSKGRDCKAGWIYHLAASQPKDGDRFKATPIYKDEDQLEEFRLRQLATFRRIADLVFANAEPQWNTSVCGNIYNRDCEYKPIHETTPLQRNGVIQQFYRIVEAWNPAEITEDQFLERDKVNEQNELELKPTGE